MTQIPWHIEGETLGRQWRVALIGFVFIGLLRFAAHAPEGVSAQAATHATVSTQQAKVDPNLFGISIEKRIGVDSPPLDDAGNSVRAQRVIVDISQALGGKPYGPHKPKS